ncbi:MAG TPA: chemotaxis protein CheB [Pyrinomonadaceae bacterium]|nr:chemotaxis protein CheB [Pyrinomonadaceae bacterium]
MEEKIVVIGTSAGGLSALQILLPGLPSEFPCPLVLVQHRGKEAGSGLCDFLQRSSRLPVEEPEDKEPIAPGRVYLAPRDYHLLIEERHFALSTAAPVSYARPSIDVLFESAADAYGKQVIGVILTGKNRDGARGLATIKQHGGLTVIEEPATAQSREMPEAALAATDVDRVLPLAGIASFLTSLFEAAAR